jgi:hypothetical protein
MGSIQLSPFGPISQARNIADLHQESCYVGKFELAQFVVWYARAGSFVHFEGGARAQRPPFVTACIAPTQATSRSLRKLFPCCVRLCEPVHDFERDAEPRMRLESPNPHTHNRVTAPESPLDPSQP